MDRAVLADARGDPGASANDYSIAWSARGNPVLFFLSRDKLIPLLHDEPPALAATAVNQLRYSASPSLAGRASRKTHGQRETMPTRTLARPDGVNKTCAHGLGTRVPSQPTGRQPHRGDELERASHASGRAVGGCGWPPGGLLGQFRGPLQLRRGLDRLDALRLLQQC